MTATELDTDTEPDSSTDAAPARTVSAREARAQRIRARRHNRPAKVRPSRRHRHLGLSTARPGTSGTSTPTPGPTSRPTPSTMVRLATTRRPAWASLSPRRLHRTAQAAPSSETGLVDALKVRNYRLYVTAQLLTSTCGWAARVAQDWLMLELTGSAALVGLTVAMQFTPMLLFGLFGGVLADRYDRRTILTITQSLFGVFTLAVGVLTLAGVVQAWHVLASAFLGGMAIVVDNPARQAFVHEIAGPKLLRRAISMNTSIFQLGALIGPAFAAALIALVGSGWAFVVNALACFTAASLIHSMRRAEMFAVPVLRRAKGQLRAGLAHVAERPEILWACVLVGFVALTGVNMATVLTAYAAEVIDLGASGYGLLTSTLAMGAITGALLAGRARRLRLRTLVAGAATLGVLQLVAALVGSTALFLLVLYAMGATCLLYLTRSNTLVQTSVDPAMRGRVLSLYVLINMGAQAASGVIIGWVCEWAGPHAGLAACAAGPLLGALVVGTILARRGHLRPALRMPRRSARSFVYLVRRPV
ncbi:MAG TPA: MFS transporter [Ruania sp.]|nr:MFS transporter [Ruania sp.]